MTIRNRELSQFGSFIYIDNTTKDIGITTEATPYVGIGTTNAEEKFHVVGQSRIDGSLNVSGIITAVSFDGQLDGNAATATTAINADNINVSSTSSTDTTTYPLLVGNSSTGNQSSFIDSSGLSYDASTNTLTSDNFSGNGSLVTNLNASNITSGTIDDAYLPPTISSDITGNAATATTATSLQTARNFSITGDFVTAPSVSFDGKSDVSIAATLTEDSVILGTYTSGDYVESLSGTLSQITVTGGSGEGSTPSISISNSLQLPGNLYVTGLSTFTGITTFTNDLYAGDVFSSGQISAAQIKSGENITIDSSSGIVTAIKFDGELIGTLSPEVNAGTATSLESARNFSITGDFITAPSVSFDGTSNVAFAATLSQNSIILGTYTSGDYVGSISGTSNEIIVTGGSGEGSTASIGLSNELELPGNLYVTGLSTFTGITTFTNDLYTEDVFSNSVNASSFYLNGSLLVEATTQIWDQASGNDVYRALGNVGIGTSTNLYKLSVNGQIESQAPQGTAPFVVRSTTNVPNLNASFLNGKTAPTGDIVGTTATQTLTSKTINLTNNTLSGTLSEFNTSLSDANFVSTTGTETLTNKTLTSPVISSISNSGIQTVPTGNGTLISTNSVGLITRTMIGDLDLVDSDISNTAAIKFSKISTVGVGNSIENDDIANSTIQNAKLVNSTISGISLGSNLNTLSPGTYLSGNPYDGSTARTWNISATSANTADTLVSRDSNGDFSAGTISATSFIGDGSQLTGITADASIKVATASTGTSATFYPTFVDSNDAPGEYKNVFTDAEITYNPSTNTLTAGTISATTIGIGATTVIDNTRKFIPVTIEAGGTVGSAGSILSSTGSGLEWVPNESEGLIGVPNIEVGIITSSSIESDNYKGVYESVSIASTFSDNGILGLNINLREASTYTYSLQNNSNIGIVSFSNMVISSGEQKATTFTLLLTQNTAGTGNTSVGIGTSVVIVPNEDGILLSPIIKSTFSPFGSDITLSTTPSDKEFVSFFIHYNGGATNSATSYDVYITKNGFFR